VTEYAENTVAEAHGDDEEEPPDEHHEMEPEEDAEMPSEGHEEEDGSEVGDDDLANTTLQKLQSA